MPNKHNAARRHHIPKMRFTVTNWAAYEAGLRRRGSLTLWVSDEAIAAWRAAPRTTPGGQARYSQTAIETALMLRLVFHQPLRQTEGLLSSLLDLLGVDLPVPDHTTISRRAARLPPVLATALPAGPVTLVIDSTGLKVYGAGEWHRDKHGVRGPRTWRKLHLAVDATSNTIVAAARDAGARAVIPPRATAVLSDTAETAPTQRDRHIQTIAEHGRLGWQRQTAYGQRAKAETAMARYKRILGDQLHARSLPGQQAEAAIGVTILNRMSDQARPNSVRCA